MCPFLLAHGLRSEQVGVTAGDDSTPRTDTPRSQGAHRMTGKLTGVPGRTSEPTPSDWHSPARVRVRQAPNRGCRGPATHYVTLLATLCSSSAVHGVSTRAPGRSEDGLSTAADDAPCFENLCPPFQGANGKDPLGTALSPIRTQETSPRVARPSTPVSK